MKTTAILTIHRLRKQWALSVFIVLVTYSCGTNPASTSSAQQKPPVQETHKSDEWPDINKLNAKGMAPLHEAVRNKDLPLARTLIQRGADVNLFSSAKMNPLYYAADCNQVEMIKLLLDAGASIDTKSIDGWGPLLISIERGYTQVAEELILRGADVKTANHFGWTAQHSATADGHLEILRLLIEYGADVNTRQFPDTVLHWAAIKGQAKAAALLIQHGALIDQMNMNGAMPLHMAISYSHKEVITVLLDNGGDPNVVATNGFTPLITAYKWPGVKDREGIALLLKLYGAE
jgi:ankyrin repeat protein